jgi:flagellar motor switch protein FliG
MLGLSDLDQTQIGGVLDSFLDTVVGRTGLTLGTTGYLRKMLGSALGEERARGVVDRGLGPASTGLERLRWMDARAIAEFVSEEHPQIQAIVMSYLDPDQAAEVMTFLPEEFDSIGMLSRVASLEPVPPMALSELSKVLEVEQKKRPSGQFAELGGTRVAADILNHMDSKIGEGVIAGIRETNETLSERIAEQMFVFDNLMALDDRGVQTLLRESPTDVLVLALKGAEEMLREKILNNMSKRAAELLRDDMETMGPVRLSEVETAQKEILLVAKKLEESGELMLGGAGAEQML